MVEDECKNQDHHGRNKRSIVFDTTGFKTDTYGARIPNITDDINDSDKITTDNIIKQLESHLDDMNKSIKLFVICC